MDVCIPERTGPDDQALALGISDPDREALKVGALMGR
jgi:hypothetical protein